MKENHVGNKEASQPRKRQMEDLCQIVCRNRLREKRLQGQNHDVLQRQKKSEE